MYKYIIKRLLLMIPVLLSIVVIIFTLMYIAPGDPAYTILGAEGVTPEGVERIHQQFGLDDPYLVQMGRYIFKLVQGDLGISYLTKQKVINEIMVRFPYTLILAFGSVFVSLFIGVIAGIIAAIKQYSVLDKTFTMISLFGVSAPIFWLAMLLILLFSLRLGWLPPSGSYGWEYWIMPIGITGLNGAAYIMRMTRSSMLEVVRQDYMRTARAKGQTEYITITRHAMKNALLPIVTATGFQVAHMFSGAVLIETVFAMPGIGKFLIDSVSNKDYPSVAGAVFFIAVACVVVNLIVDVIYVFIDPRIKTAYQANKKKNRPVINAGNGNSEKAGVLNG